MSERYSQDELEEHYNEAVEAGQSPWPMNECELFYRNDNYSSWDEIESIYEGVIQTKPKKVSGDPGNPLNDRLDGIFFSVNVDRYGEPVDRSPFGPKRWLIPISKAVEVLAEDEFESDSSSSSITMDEEESEISQNVLERDLTTKLRLYFADYNVNNNSHYVILVLVQKDSEADEFAAKNLLEIDIEDNNLFCCENDEDGYPVFRVSQKIWVNIFYTKELRLDMGDFSQQRF
jgi:hypothetical protein